MKILYYTLEVLITYLAVIGTWEIAQATVPRGTLSNVLKNNEAEKQYNICFESSFINKNVKMVV
jgi:hypothetical protein